MTQKIATRAAYGEALVELGAENPRVVVLDADLSKSTMTAKFAEKYPDRFFNMGIAEQNLVGTAAGLAAGGMIPFASTFAVFASGRAFEQIRNAVAYPGLNVKIGASHAGLTVGEDGASHQAVEDIAIMRAIPKMTVIVPADATEAKKATKAAVAYDGPVYLRFGRLPVPVLLDEGYQFEISKAAVLRDGKDVAIIACGVMVGEALKAAEELQAAEISARVINMSTIKPLDEAAVIDAARTCGAIVTAEEHNIIGGLGGAVAEVLAEKHPVPLQRVGVRDTFGESGTPDELLAKYGLTAAEIVKAARVLIGRKGA